jgi:hypothetical protein
LFVDASGNIGINKTPDFSLDVKGRYQTTAARFLRSADYGEVIRIGRDSVSETVSFNYPANGVLAIHTAGSERFRITDAGLVGIGTSSPQSLLSVVKSAEGTALEALRLVNQSPNQRSTSSVYIGMYGSEETYERARILCGNPTDFDGNNGFLSFWTRASNTLSERLRITAAGNVGIGTTAAVGKISVETSSATDPNTVVTAGWDSTYVLIGDSDNANGANLGLGFRTGGVTSGFGTQIVSLDPNADWYPINYHGNLHVWYGSGTERARIDGSGRLLVGTSSDSGGALLQVNGDRVRIATAKTPASASDTGVAGEICWDANYVYVCTATNTWKRTAISTW